MSICFKGGIGKEVVRKLANAKAKVVLVDLNEDAVKAVQTEFGLTEQNSLVVKADVSNEESVKKFQRNFHFLLSSVQLLVIFL